MKDIILRELVLKNFKGLRDFKLRDINGDISIFGDNATGKTTIFDAVTWLLWGKDSLNSANFNIKTLENGEPLHHLDHSVSAVLENDEESIVLGKIYREKWTKKRGEAHREFSGHTTDHFIDDVPVQKKEFDVEVANICPEDLFKLLTNPRYFNESVHWQERRKILLEVCGDITDGDVIASNAELADLPDILGRRKLEDHKKVIDSRRREINKELERIPVRIDEISASEVTVDKSLAAIEKEIGALRDQRLKKREVLTAIETGGDWALKQKEINELQAKIAVKEAEITRGQMDVDQKTSMGLYRLEREAKQSGDDVADEIKAKDRIDNELVELSGKLAAVEKEILGMRDKWHAENQKEMEFSQETVCPTCGQDIPENQLAEAREKAQADFNGAKARALKAISSGGKSLAGQADKLKTELKDASDQIEIKNKQIASLQLKYDKALAKFTDAQAGEDELYKGKSDPEYDRFLEQEKSMLEELAKIDGRRSVESSDIKIEIAGIDDQISTLTKDKLQIEANGRIKTRVQELQNQEKSLAVEFEKLERELNLVDLFVRTKVDLLDKKINSKFNLARFELFRENINGGLEPVCNTTYDGVPYNDLNNGSRINIGMDVINTLSEHYGIALPIFIDNAESVTSLLPTESQQIRLVVSKPDKELRIEK